MVGFFAVTSCHSLLYSLALARNPVFPRVCRHTFLVGTVHIRDKRHKRQQRDDIALTGIHNIHSYKTVKCLFQSMNLRRRSSWCSSIWIQQLKICSTVPLPGLKPPCSSSRLFCITVPTMAYRPVDWAPFIV